MAVLTGRSPDNALGRPIGEVFPEMQSSALQEGTLCLQHPPLEAALTRLPQGGWAVQVVQRDSTLQQQRRILEKIATGAPLSLVLEDIVAYLEEGLPGCLCSVLTKHGDKLHMACAPHLDPNYVEKMKTIPIGPNAGSCGTAAYRKEAVVVDDIASDPLWLIPGACALEHGLRACWAYPIQARTPGKDLLGVFSFYFRDCVRPQPHQQQIIADAQYLTTLALESELRERQLHAFIDHAADPIFIHDQDGRVLMANAQACRTLGYSREELLGQYPALFDVQAKPEFLKSMLSVLDQYQDVNLDSRHTRKDGTTFPVEIRLRAFDAWGQRLAIAVVRDMTLRREQEEALRASAESLRRTQRIAGVENWTYDIRSGRFQNLESQSQALGVPPSTYEELSELFHPEDRERVVRQWRETLETGSPYQVIHRFLRGGEVRWISVWAEARRDESGRLVAVDGVAQDITSLRKLEDQLHQAQKMESIGRLAGGIAHDFNNLLTVINGQTDLLLADLGKEDPNREILLSILECGERAAGLTRQLLSYSRKSILQPRLLNLNELVSSSVSMLRRLMGEDIQLAMHLDARVKPVKLDPNQFQQVLLNLAVNARDAMPSGGAVNISTHQAELSRQEAAELGTSPGCYVCLRFEDSGSGMTEEVVERIFEPFYTTKGLGQGTGLGLAVVQGVVRQSGGAIRCLSTPGSGTCFSIFLPVASPKILLSGLDASLNRLIRKILEDQGYEVQHGAGVESSPAVDLVIADALSHPPPQKAPCLLLSAEPLQHRDFLLKPFTVAELGQRVQELLSHR